MKIWLMQIACSTQGHHALNSEKDHLLIASVFEENCIESEWPIWLPYKVDFDITKRKPYYVKVYSRTCSVCRPTE